MPSQKQTNNQKQSVNVKVVVNGADPPKKKRRAPRKQQPTLADIPVANNIQVRAPDINITGFPVTPQVYRPSTTQIMPENPMNPPPYMQSHYTNMQATLNSHRDAMDQQFNELREAMAAQATNAQHLANISAVVGRAQSEADSQLNALAAPLPGLSQDLQGRLDDLRYGDVFGGIPLGPSPAVGPALTPTDEMSEELGSPVGSPVPRNRPPIIGGFPEMPDFMAAPPALDPGAPGMMDMPFPPPPLNPSMSPPVTEELAELGAPRGPSIAEIEPMPLPQLPAPPQQPQLPAPPQPLALPAPMEASSEDSEEAESSERAGLRADLNILREIQNSLDDVDTKKNKELWYATRLALQRIAKQFNFEVKDSSKNTALAKRLEKLVANKLNPKKKVKLDINKLYGYN